MNWAIMAGFIAIGISDLKFRTIPYLLLIAVAILSLIGRTTIEICSQVAIGVVALIGAFVLYRLGQWSKGDVGLAGVVGLAFGTQTPYVLLITALAMIIYQRGGKLKEGLPLGVPVAVGAVVVTIINAL